MMREKRKAVKREYNSTDLKKCLKKPPYLRVVPCIGKGMHNALQ